MAFEILYSPDAVDHLAAFPKADQVSVIDQIYTQLTLEPALSTNQRKVLRPNPIAPWVLRLGNIRVFYSILEVPKAVVHVIAVGKKVHNDLWIGGQKVEL